MQPGDCVHRHRAWLAVVALLGLGAAAARERKPLAAVKPNDPEIAHTQGELVTRASIERCYDVLSQFVGVA